MIAAANMEEKMRKEIKNSIKDMTEEKIHCHWVHLKIVKEENFLLATQVLDSPEKAVEMVHDFLVDKDREYFFTCYTDTKMHPLCIEVTAIGTLNQSIVGIKEIFKTALLCNAAGVLCFHNHPSGDITPSKDDIFMTKRIKKAGELLEIQLFDHIIVGENKYLSFKEKQYL